MNEVKTTRTNSQDNVPSTLHETDLDFLNTTVSRDRIARTTALTAFQYP